MTYPQVRPRGPGTGRPPRRPARAGLLERVRAHRWPLLFVTPMLVLFGAFTIWPMISSWYYSLFDWDGVEPLSEFVGLANFQELWSDPLFWSAFRHSFYFSLAAVLIEVPLALALASMLNRRWLLGRNLYRLLLFLPVVSTTAVIGIVFVILLDPAGGPVNDALRALGVDEPVNFLGDSATALPTIIAIDIWKGFGFTLVYWMAALQTIPDDVYEAARIDGAGPFQTMTRVTLPMIAPLAVIIVVLTFQRSLNPFDLVQAMTEGGPGKATDVMATYVYRSAFNPDFVEPRYGLASAAGALFGITILVVTVLLGVLLRKMNQRRRELLGASGAGA